MEVTMRNKPIILGLVAIGLAALVTVQLGASFGNQEEAGAKKKSVVQRGNWLVNLGGCNHCHSPKVLSPQGPVPDASKLLSGHPVASTIPEIPPGVLAPEKWGALVTGDLTAWAGPWGVSFGANLTSDVATGIGSWTDAMFIKALRTGKHMGEGRNILPPMPWPDIGQLNDNDLKAIFAYLKSLKPVANAVPDPIPPSGPAPMK